MIQCENCSKYFDETMAVGICPHCGYSKEDVAIDPRWLPIGTLLNGRYEIVKVVAAGGFGITYKVVDTKTHAYKAVKEYFQQGVVNRIPGTTNVLITAPKRKEEFEYGKARLLNEAQIVAKFQSPNIVKVDDYFEENNTAYMVMEFLESQTLEEYILERRRVLEPEQAIEIGVKICDALEVIHKAGIVHRDIAPDNIFIDATGEIKIIDFGSARLSKEDTDDKLIVLKPGFAPPEQYEKIDLSNDKQKSWTDVYALGAILYFSLTGKIPAEASDRKIVTDATKDPVCYPKEINPHIPEFLNNTIMTAMAINIHERFKNASELKAALLQEKKVLPVEKVRKRKKLKRTAGIGGSLLLIALLVAYGVLHFNEKKEESVLAQATVTVWYSIDEDESIGQEKIDTMEDIKAEIESSDVFADITIELTAIPEAEYEAKLMEANEQGQLPSLYEVSDIEEVFVTENDCLKEVLADIEKDSCYFVDDYADDFIKNNRVPLGFHIPVIYINTSLVNDYVETMEITSMSDIMALCEGEMKYKPMVMKENLRSNYEMMFSDFEDYSSCFEGNSLEMFLNGEAVLYFSDTADYFKVREAIPSSFAMEAVCVDSLVCDFTNYWSIGAINNNAEEIATEEILSYFYSNYVQDRYYLQTSMPGLPLEKRALYEYGEVRRQLVDFVAECEEYKFITD